MTLGSVAATTSAAGSTTLFHSAITPPQAAAGYTPVQIAQAYDFTPLYARGIDGAGQKVALIEVGRASSSDIAAFDKASRLAAPSITEYYPQGVHPSSKPDPETTLDLEWVHALAPRAAVQIYYISQNASARSWSAMAKAIRSAANRGVGAVSISLGTCGPTPSSSVVSSALANVESRGVSVFVASGDDGPRPGTVRECGRGLGVGYPASDPSVVAVGGTSLELNPDNTIADEYAWTLSGGGRAATFSRPLWQVAPTLSDDGKRWAPDVAFLADTRTGVGYYFKNRWHRIGGTSLGAPAWAAAWTLVRENAKKTGVTVGAAPPLIYKIGNSQSYTTAFHDITDGSNGPYDAGTGWDPVTGWGTPDVAQLASIVRSLS